MIKVGFFLTVLMLSAACFEEHQLVAFRDTVHGFMRGMVQDEQYDIPDECMTRDTAVAFFELYKEYSQLNIFDNPAADYLKLLHNFGSVMKTEFGLNCRFEEIL